MNIDFAPTLLDMAGLEIPKEIQGKSLKPIFENEGKTPSDWRKATYYHYYEYPSWHSVKRHYGIRTNNFKLIHFYNDVDEWELYDMNKDPQEMMNAFGDPGYKKVQKEMMKLIKDVQTGYGESQE